MALGLSDLLIQIVSGHWPSTWPQYVVEIDSSVRIPNHWACQLVSILGI